jgi:hypothetical protein
VVSSTYRSLCHGERPGIRFIGGLFGLRAGLGAAENLVRDGVQDQNCPACNESLYRQNYPGSIIRISNREISLEILRQITTYCDRIPVKSVRVQQDI